MASTQPSTQKVNLKIFGKKLQKINCETFHRKTYFAWFCEFVSNLLSKIVWGNRSLFLTRYRLLDLTFSEDFSIRKAHSLFKLIFKASQLQKTPEYDIFQKAILCTLSSTMNLGLNTVPVAAGKYLWKDFTFIY